MNHDIQFKCLVRRSHFTKDSNDAEKFDPCVAFGVQSISGKILTFHIMTDYGMLRSRVPISEIFLFIPKSDIPETKELCGLLICLPLIGSTIPIAKNQATISVAMCWYQMMAICFANQTTEYTGKTRILSAAIFLLTKKELKLTTSYCLWKMYLINGYQKTQIRFTIA